MRRRVPLNAVRAFEAAARYTNLVRAADELCVTPTAVSHQIRQLEDFLQTKLFLRKNSRLELTPEARVCLSKLTDAFDLIDDAFAELVRDGSEREVLRVGASVSLATLWLMPRLGEFVAAAPEVDVSVASFVKRQEAESGKADLWICNWQTAMDQRVELLMEEEVFPVCSPELAARFDNDWTRILREAPLIHQDMPRTAQNGPYPDWERYLREFGVSRNDATKGPRFNQASACISAAKIGLGVILGRSILIEDSLRSGALQQVSEAYPIRSPYYVVSSWNPIHPNTVESFKAWLFEKAKDTVASGRAVMA